jgi:hypothetical protein
LPIKDAVEAIKILSVNHKIVLITSRDERMEKETAKWVALNIGEEYRENVHVLGNKKTKDKPKSKGEICKEVGASWLIDDNPEHCLSALQNGVEAILLGDYGWHYDAPNHLVICNNWQEILALFDNEKRS